MAYMRNQRGRLGLGGIGDVATAATHVIEDPCLFQVAALTDELGTAVKALVPGSSGPSGPGIGLCNAVKPLQLAVYVAQRPWIVPVGAVAIIGGLLGIGYLIGRGGR